MKRVNKKGNQLGLLCARSNAWKPLRDFKQEWHVIFDFGTWDMTLFFSQHCFQMCLPDPLSSTFDDISRRSCRFPVRFSSKDSLALTMDSFTDIKKSSRVYIQTESHDQSIASLPSAQPWAGAWSLPFVLSFLFRLLQEKIWRKGGFKEKRKVSFCGFIFRFGRLCKLSVPCTSLTWVMFSRDQLLWYLPSSCVQKCILQCLSPGRSGYLKDGRSPASLCDMTFPWKCVSPCWELRLIHWLFSSPSWVVFRLLQEKSRHLPLSSHMLADSRGCKSSFPENPLLQANVAQWTSAGKWVSSVLPWRHLTPQSKSILMSHFPWLKGQWSLLSLWEREKKSQNIVFLHPRPQWPPLPW